MANIIEIHAFSDPALDVYARLTENQLLNRADPDNALFVAESPLVIGRALDAGCEPVSFLMERQHTQGKGREILARCCQDIPVYTADASVLTQLTGFHLTRGMLCAMRRPKLQSVEDVCRDARRVVVLENVMNPTNIGAIFRSRRRARHGRGAAHDCGQRSALSPLLARQHGKCVPHPVDLPARKRRLDAASARSRLPHSRDGHCATTPYGSTIRALPPKKSLPSSWARRVTGSHPRPSRAATTRSGSRCTTASTRSTSPQRAPWRSTSWAFPPLNEKED